MHLTPDDGDDLFAGQLAHLQVHGADDVQLRFGEPHLLDVGVDFCRRVGREGVGVEWLVQLAAQVVEGFDFDKIQAFYVGFRKDLKVKDNFADKHEIETASVESFLYQAGYLTIKNWRDNEITLDYPNEEVKSSLADMYLDDVYHIEGYMTLGEDIWKSLEESNIENLVKIFNIALKGVPYEDFKANSNIESDEYSKYRIINEVGNEFWYRSMFVMLLRGAGIMYYAEVHTFRGRSDVVIVFKNKIVVIEFKFAKTSSEIEAKRKEGEEQIKSRDYASPYEGIGKEIITAVLIANDEKRQVSL